MNRREAIKSSVLSLPALSTVPGYRNLEESIKARHKAYEFLVKVANFSDKECHEAYKAIAKKWKDKEEVWARQFYKGTHTRLFMSSFFFEMMLYWQAVRLTFLLGVDGFALLQIDEDQYRKILDKASENWNKTY